MTPVKRRSRIKGGTSAEDWTVMWTETAEECEECITDGEFLWPIIRTAIIRLIEEGRTSVPALEIRCMEMVGSIWVTVRREDVEVTLKKELNWRISREEYEECAEIRDLLERFESEVPGSGKKSANTEEI
jgi:hypothetical protein